MKCIYFKSNEKPSILECSQIPQKIGNDYFLVTEYSVDYIFNNVDEYLAYALSNSSYSFPTRYIYLLDSINSLTINQNDVGGEFHQDFIVLKIKNGEIVGMNKNEISYVLNLFS